MAWSVSAWHRAALTDILGNTTAMDLSGTGVDTPKVALFNNSITPDKDATAANSAFNVGQWANTNEVSQVTTWPAGGVALASTAVSNPSSGRIMVDANDTASGAACTLANVYGCLVYDDTLTTPVADQGICFNYFGGVQSVTAGVFTVVWDTNGIAYISV